MDNTTLSEVTTIITDFNPNFTNFYPTLAVVITLILDDMKVTERIVMYEHNNSIMNKITTPTCVLFSYKFNLSSYVGGLCSTSLLVYVSVISYWVIVDYSEDSVA